VIGVLLDGQTKYDYGNDGDSQALGGCSVRHFLILILAPAISKQLLMLRLRGSG
jgi:hypothetical protein